MRLLLVDTHLLVWAMGSPEWLPAALGTARWPAADHKPGAPSRSAPLRRTAGTRAGRRSSLGVVGCAQGWGRAGAGAAQECIELGVELV